MFGFTLANFVVVIPYILAFFAMFNVELALNNAVEYAEPAISRHGRNLLVLGGFMLGAVLWWLALTSLINLFRKGFRPRHMLTINRVAGVVIAVLGLVTLVSQFIE